MANSQAPLPLIEYDAFLFDLDGTLLDTAEDLGAALNAVLINNKIEPVSSDIYRPAASNGAGALLEAG
ncbi:HAD hydrolase-like protein, partial [Pseudoalteromonas sp. TB25]